MYRPLATIAALALLAAAAESTDITARVIAETNLDEMAAEACAGVCGNKGWSRLDSVHIAEKAKNLYLVTARGTAKYHQHTPAPELFGHTAGQGLDLEYLVYITATGDLDASTCDLTVTDIQVQGDNLGIAEGATTLEGRTYRLEGCARLL